MRLLIKGIHVTYYELIYLKRNAHLESLSIFCYWTIGINFHDWHTQLRAY